MAQTRQGQSRSHLEPICPTAAGVYLLTHVRFVGQPIGVAFAFANAALFAAYIVLARIATRLAMGGIDGLAMAMMFASVFVCPIGLTAAGRAFSDPVALAAGVGVGVFVGDPPACLTSSRWAACRAPPTRCSSRCGRRNAGGRGSPRAGTRRRGRAGSARRR